MQLHLMSLVILFFSLATLADYRAFFSPFDDLDQVLQEQIAEEPRRIDIAIYTFRSKPVLQKLIAALDRGTQVRLLIRPANRSQTANFVRPLFERGAEIRYVTKTNHHKFALLHFRDESRLLSSSGNFNNSRLQKSYDENLFVCSSCGELITTFQEEFDYLFKHSNALIGPNDVSSLPDQRTRAFRDGLDGFFTSHNFTPFFNNRTQKISFRKKRGGEASVRNRLIDEIHRAQNSIQIATGHFRSYLLFQALKKAQRRGVDVEMIVDNQEYITAHWQSVEDERVAECVADGDSMVECTQKNVHFARKAALAGINVRFKYYSLKWDFIRAPQMHHKYMIIDGRRVFTGSYNWSNNAEFNTFENVAEIRDRSVVRQYVANFERLGDHGRSRYPVVHDNLADLRLNIDIHFRPMFLKLKEIDELRELACKKCPHLFCKAEEEISQTIRQRCDTGN